MHSSWWDKPHTSNNTLPINTLISFAINAYANNARNVTQLCMWHAFCLITTATQYSAATDISHQGFLWFGLVTPSCLYRIESTIKSSFISEVAFCHKFSLLVRTSRLIWLALLLKTLRWWPNVDGFRGRWCVVNLNAIYNQFSLFLTQVLS